MNMPREDYLYFTESYEERIQSKLSGLKEAERKAADFILANKAGILNLSVHELSQQCGCSSATVIRLCQHLGYKGFAELKFQIRSENGFAKDNLSISAEDDPSSMKQKSFQFTQDNLKAMIDHLDDALLDKAAELLVRADRILFSAMGSAGGVALSAANLFLSNKLNAFFPLDEMTQMRIAASLGPKDVVIGISYDGYIRAVADSFMAARAAGASTILITSFEDSLAAGYADIVLYTNVRNNRNALNYSSTNICQMMIIQLLLVSVWQKNGFRQHEQITQLRALTNLKRYPAGTAQIDPPSDSLHYPR